MLPRHQPPTEWPSAIPRPTACPFRDLAAGVCRAAIFALPLDQRRQNGYCDHEDHDDCALFLSRLLRVSRPLTFDRQNREFGLK